MVTSSHTCCFKTISTGLRQTEPRSELETIDINREYLSKNELEVIVMGPGTTWLDTGTHDALIDASIYLHMIQAIRGLKISCPEEIFLRKHWISDDQICSLC